MTVQKQINEPIFLITSLRKLLVEVYGTLTLGLALGLLLGAMIWR